jgi:hypothetical protein
LLCEAAMVSKPYLTWDTIMGDEGCGEAVKEFFEAVLRIPGNGAASADRNSAFCRF